MGLKRTSLLRGLLAAVSLAVLIQAAQHTQAAETKKNRWESAIQRFEAADRKEFPPKHGILFVGSSSIMGWDLKKYFGDLPTINRGFGGSDIADSLHFAQRIVLPYQPRVIVFYAGDNDIAGGKSPERVLRDYQKFVEKVHGTLPETRIVFVAIKPSRRRWKLVAQMREANALVRTFAEKNPRLEFVDIDKPMLGDDGKPRAELLKADGLHLTAKGYALWSKLVQPHLRLADVR